MRIGVFDSGIGGLSTLLACLRYLPDAHFIFYGDSAYSPYGDKTPTTVQRRTEAAYTWFVRAGVDAVVLACNTATSAAVAPLRALADVPIIGIEPAIKKALNEHPEGEILLLATAMTVAGEKLRILLNRLEGGASKVRPIACAGLAEIIESQACNWEDQVRRYLQVTVLPHCGRNTQAIVLGCTHYCWIHDPIAEVLGTHLALVDGNDGVARQLCRSLDISLATQLPPELPERAFISLYFTAEQAEKTRITHQLLASQGVLIQSS